jgi:hypothetical protein
MNKHEDDKRETEELCNRIIGMDLETATDFLQKLSKTIRVYRKDGHLLMMTRDYRINRVNVNVADGIVIDAHIG